MVPSLTHRTIVPPSFPLSLHYTKTGIHPPGDINRDGGDNGVHGVNPIWKRWQVLWRQNGCCLTMPITMANLEMAGKPRQSSTRRQWWAWRTRPGNVCKLRTIWSIDSRTALTSFEGFIKSPRFTLLRLALQRPEATMMMTTGKSNAAAIALTRVDDRQWW